MDPLHPSYSIAFICTANVCRSAMAHAICTAELARRGWNVALHSGGVLNLGGVPPYECAFASCRDHGTPLTKPASTFVGDLPLTTIDRFFVMEERHAEELATIHGVAPSRIALLGILDPEGGNPQIDDPINQGSLATERCYQRLRRCITHYLDTTKEIPEAAKSSRLPDQSAA